MSLLLSQTSVPNNHSLQRRHFIIYILYSVNPHVILPLKLIRNMVNQRPHTIYHFLVRQPLTVTFFTLTQI